jgi:hypothetical protein
VGRNHYYVCHCAKADCPEPSKGGWLRPTRERLSYMPPRRVRDDALVGCGHIIRLYHASQAWGAYRLSLASR